MTISATKTVFLQSWLKIVNSEKKLLKLVIKLLEIIVLDIKTREKSPQVQDYLSHALIALRTAQNVQGFFSAWSRMLPALWESTQQSVCLVRSLPFDEAVVFTKK